MEPITAQRAQQIATEKNAPPSIDEVFDSISSMSNGGHFFTYTKTLLTAYQVKYFEGLGYTITGSRDDKKNRIGWESPQHDRIGLAITEPDINNFGDNDFATPEHLKIV